MIKNILLFGVLTVTTGCASLNGASTSNNSTDKKAVHSTQATEEKNINNVQIYENIQSTFTDCEGNPKAAWVLISPRAFPESLSGKFALLKFQVDDETKPYDVNLVEGDTEIADWSTRALLRSKFPNKPSSCWLVKYEYVD